MPLSPWPRGESLTPRGPSGDGALHAGRPVWQKSEPDREAGARECVLEQDWMVVR